MPVTRQVSAMRFIQRKMAYRVWTLAKLSWRGLALGSFEARILETTIDL